MVKNFEDMFIRFDKMYERDRHTDGRTDRHRMTAKITWSWNRQPPNAQMQAKTKYSSYHSLGQSAGVFSGVSKHSSRKHSICR